MKNNKHIKNFNEVTEKPNIFYDKINEIYVPKEDRKMYDLLTTFFGVNGGEVLTVKIRNFIDKMKKKDNKTFTSILFYLEHQFSQVYY